MKKLRGILEKLEKYPYYFVQATDVIEILKLMINARRSKVTKTQPRKHN